jgi:hypothetical protein
MGKCQFVDPSYNVVCGSSDQTTKIVFESPSGKTNIVIFCCKRHGDMRFNALSRSEDEIKKEVDRNHISWSEQKEQMREIRWNNCRRCNIALGKKPNYCVTYYAIKDDQIRMRRSFLLDYQCARSELTLYGIGKEVPKNQTLDKLI